MRGMCAAFISRGRWSAAFVLTIMAFSYTFGANPPIDFPRLLLFDTQQFAKDGVTRAYIFEDSEINALSAIVSNVWQSSMKYSGTAGVATLPSPPTNYLRIAALGLDAIASNKARLSSITQLLDVKLSPAIAAKALREQAQAFRDADDNSMAFVIIEQVTTPWAYRDRWWNEVQRMAA